MLPENASDRAERLFTILWVAIFLVVGMTVTGFLMIAAPTGHDPVLATQVASKPPCPNNAVIVRHNTYPSCDLSHGGILIELGTSRLECENQGGRFVVHIDRRMCVGEDI